MGRAALPSGTRAVRGAAASRGTLEHLPRRVRGRPPVPSAEGDLGDLLPGAEAVEDGAAREAASAVGCGCRSGSPAGGSCRAARRPCRRRSPPTRRRAARRSTARNSSRSRRAGRGRSRPQWGRDAPAARGRDSRGPDPRGPKSGTCSPAARWATRPRDCGRAFILAPAPVSLPPFSGPPNRRDGGPPGADGPGGRRRPGAASGYGPRRRTSRSGRRRATGPARCGPTPAVHEHETGFDEVEPLSSAATPSYVRGRSGTPACVRYSSLTACIPSGSRSGVRWESVR